jgi:hypothetical protein
LQVGGSSGKRREIGRNGTIVRRLALERWKCFGTRWGGGCTASVVLNSTKLTQLTLK